MAAPNEKYVELCIRPVIDAKYNLKIHVHSTVLDSILTYLKKKINLQYTNKIGWYSNVTHIEAKQSESFDNGIFFFIQVKQTHSIVRKLFSKQSIHFRQKENYFRSKVNTFNSKKIIFEAK
jgi:hypothetical protein